VGGVGGSGTRVAAAILGQLGVYLGGDLNESLDNLWFSFLFVHLSALDQDEETFDEFVRMFVKAMTGQELSTEREAALLEELCARTRPQPVEWLRARAASLRGPRAERGSGPWGWKEPNTHLFVERLLTRLPDLRYVHVLRHGLDMAFSTNQQQVLHWGGKVLGDFEPTPRSSLQYWCAVNSRIESLRSGGRHAIHILRFDRLCLDPRAEVEALLRFLGRPYEEAQVSSLARLVAPPASIGRFRDHDLGQFRPQDLDTVRALGFDV
jgi:hypothetical protein